MYMDLLLSAVNCLMKFYTKFVSHNNNRIAKNTELGNKSLCIGNFEIVSYWELSL